MLNWAYFPRSAKPVALAVQVVDVFKGVQENIASEQHRHSSNTVLQHVAEGLKAIGFSVEVGKKKSEKIYVPVLYGNNGKVAKAYEADAHHAQGRFVVEIEAGRATINNQFLKDLIQACLMDDVDYAAIAVRTCMKRQASEIQTSIVA